MENNMDNCDNQKVPFFVIINKKIIILQLFHYYYIHEIALNWLNNYLF